MMMVSTITDALGRAAVSVFRQVIGPVIGAAVVGYFAYYAVQGDRGLMALRHLQGEIAEAERILQQTRGDRERMERRAQLLRADNLDPDMLEERARGLLNLSHPNDVIITLPPSPRGGEDAVSGGIR